MKQVTKNSPLKKITNLFSLISLRDFRDLFYIAASLPVGFVLRIFKKNIWLVSEMEHTARDNGYWFFKYLRENYPEKSVYYPLQFSSADYEKIAPLGNIIRHGSFKHHIYCWAAKLHITTRTGRGLPARLFSPILQKRGFYPFKEIFLQHGVTMNNVPILWKSQTNFDMLIATGEREAKGLNEMFGYDSDIIKIVGFTRFDNLNEFKVDKKQILLMPTWRWWLYPNFGKVSEKALNEIANSNYVKTYCSFLKSKRLNDFLEKNDLHILFFPHNQMQPFLKAFEGENSRIKLASTEEYDVQDALKESAYLITDYSSIIFDFAYMKKPMALFQFDLDEFREKHYSEGYFSYENDGFGPVVKTEDELVDTIIKSFEDGFLMEKEYEKRVDNTFAFRDSKNCKRTLEVIENTFCQH